MVHCLIASRVAAIYVWLGTRGTLGIQVIHEDGVAVRAAASVLTSAVRIDGHLYGGGPGDATGFSVRYQGELLGI